VVRREIRGETCQIGDKMNIVIVSYKVNGQFGYDGERDKVLEILAAKFGGRRTGFGSGFGERDLEFGFETHFQANDFAQRAEQEGCRTRQD